MKKNTVFFTFFFFFFIIIFYIYINKKSTTNVVGVSTEIVTNSTLLTKHFITNEEKANDFFKNKVIEIKGHIKDINFKNNKKTIVLNGHNNKFNVICDMQNSLKKENDSMMRNQEVVIKGICKGFLQDVIILNCVLINK